MKKIILELTVLLLITGCSSSKKEEVKVASTESSNTQNASEKVPADPYAAMETERNAVHNSIIGNTTVEKQEGENKDVKVYSGTVMIMGKGTEAQTVILHSNQGDYVLVGQKAGELVNREGKLLTIMGKPTKGAATLPDYKDLPQLDVQGISKAILQK